MVITRSIGALGAVNDFHFYVRSSSFLPILTILAFTFPNIHVSFLATK
jgi:hypothetical protein